MQQQALDVAKPFVLFVEFKKPDGDSFNFGWKFYSSEDGARQAFHALYKKRSLFQEFKMQPVCKIKGCGMTSIFEINQ